MGGRKEIMTKGQIAAHFSNKFGMTRRTAASIIDEYCSPGYF